MIIKDGAFLFDNQETKAQLELKLIQAEVAGFLQVDFDDLAGFIGGKPGTKESESTSDEHKKQAAATTESDRIFPDQLYDLERLRAMDADVRLRAKRILAPNLPIDDLDAK